MLIILCFTQEVVRMRPNDPGISARLAEELYRLGESNTEAAKKIKCHPNLVGQWLSKSYIPSAHYFKNLHEAGCDIIYILTGERRA